MDRVKIDGFLVAGIKTRTNNKNEQNPKTSKIAKLWQDFYSLSLADKIISNKKDIYGVYSSYKSDVNGDFDVLAGVKTVKESVDFENISIIGGDYLVFKKNGTMPQAVIEAWQDVWNYFENSKELRAYITDFEKYIDENHVEIYISIK